MMTEQDFLKMEESFTMTKREILSVAKVVCLPYAVGKQPSIPLIIVEQNGR